MERQWPSVARCHAGRGSQEGPGSDERGSGRRAGECDFAVSAQVEAVLTTAATTNLSARVFGAKLLTRQTTAFRIAESQALRMGLVHDP